MPLKIESRGKYAGVKIHLDAKDSQELLDWLKFYETQGNTNVATTPLKFAKAMAKAIKNLLAENPDVLKERTPEQIKKAMLKDKAKIEKQLAAGGDWKQVE